MTNNVVPIRRSRSDPADELLAAPSNGSHLVHFYEDDRVLFDVAGRFIGAGLRAGERALLVATQEHARGIAPHLESAGVEEAVTTGRLLLLDADETLSRFMTGDAPDRKRFRAIVAEAFERLTGGAPGVRVRAFGEMVDLLCRRGQRRAALRLEELWNEVIAERPVSLLCAYVMSSFYDRGGDRGEGFADVCQLHTHVLPPESFANVERSGEPLVEISRLSDAARLVDAERRFRLIVTSMRDYAVFMLDPRGVVATWNSGAERIKGWTHGEIVGRHFSVLYPPQDVAAGKCELALAVAAGDGRYEDEGWRVRKDGSFFWAHVIITALREGGQLVGFAKVTRDMKAQTRLARQSLRELSAPIAIMQLLVRDLHERGGRATAAEVAIMEQNLRQLGDMVRSLGG